MMNVSMKSNTPIKIFLFLGSILVVSACTTIPKDGGVGSVQALIDAQVGYEKESSVLSPDQALTAEQVNTLLSGPLGLADAERISMQINPIAKANILTVGIAEADYAQAGRLENPGFGYERFTGQDYTASLLFDIGELFLMPLKRQIEGRRLEIARYEAAGSVMTHLANTRRFWIEAVTEKQQTQLLLRAVESVETGNNLTRQMSALGHSGVIEAAESELFVSEMRTALSKQQLAEGAAREALIRQLGLWGDQARILLLPDALPKIPTNPIEIASVEQQAIENRLDVKVAKLNIEKMAENFNLGRKSAFFSAAELGHVMEKTEGEKERGYELEFRIPIFDSGGIKNEKAKMLFEQAQAQAEATAIAAASNARSALAEYLSTWEIATHFVEEVLPLRQRLSQEQLLMYNGMLISVFDLLKDVRSAIDVEANYVDAIRDFWLADTNLQQALTGADSAPMSFASAGAMPSAGADSEGH
jgi:outer membrane protein TolC